MNNVEISALRNADYYYVLLQAVQDATTRVWASVFSMNMNYLDDRNLKVRDLLGALASATRRGVDVRVLMSGEQTQYNRFRVANELSFKMLGRSGIAARRYVAGEKKASHAKYVLVDTDAVLLGSHNWSPRSFSLGRDDSMLLRSLDFGERMGKQFADDWARGEVTHVSQ